MKTTQIIQTNTLPAPDRFGPGAVLLYDRTLPRRLPGFADWTRRFPRSLAVTAGESTKSVDAFPAHARKLTTLTAGFSRSEATLVAAGGGSVGDLAGFLASVLQRGIRLIHLPSTWLAAMDSAHGGKTALNVGGVKNQIGTFYPASQVFLVKELLFTQPRARARDGLAELVKMAFLDNGPWAERLQKDRRKDAELIWPYLRPAIQAKMAVVALDPEERTGHRQILNLGHTVGHVLEAYHGLSHGRAVAQGLFFALDWSRARVRLPARNHDAAVDLLTRCTGERPLPGRTPPVPRRTFVSLLGQDKKGQTRDRVTFVFLRGPGQPVRRPVTHAEVVDEARSKGWVA